MSKSGTFALGPLACGCALKEHGYLDMCDMHKAAPALLAALKWILREFSAEHLDYESSTTCGSEAATAIRQAEQAA